MSDASAVIKNRLRSLACALVGLVGLSAPRAARADDETSSTFVQVRDARFVRGDTPFRFVGANAAVMHGSVDRAAYEATLDAVAADGASVVRVWAFGEAAADAPSWWDDYAFRRGDAWVESSFVHLDRVLAAARDRDLRVILVLGNRWADYGGAPELARRSGHAPAARDLSATELERFFRSAACREAYRLHVERVVSRVNSVSGVAYRDDPTIFSYELMNEASAFDEQAGDGLVEWVEFMARSVRSLDDRHLIAAGHIGYRTRAERRVWARVQSIADVSYADAHMYPESDPRIDSANMLSRAIRDRVALAHDVAGKPLVLGEFGFARAWKGRARPRAFDTFLSSALEAGTDGVLAWIYQPWPGQERAHSVFTDGPSTRTAQGVRRAIRESARRAARESVSSSTARASVTRLTADAPPLYRSTTRLLRAAPTRPRWRRSGDEATLRVRAREYVWLEAESFGDAHDAEYPHLWLSGESELRYFVPDVPRRSPASLSVTLHVSAELPGVDDEPSAGRTSALTLRLDGELIGEVIAPVDDGRGGLITLTTHDPRVLARLSRRGGHWLAIEARDNLRSRGVAIYGDVVLSVP
jgi:mannan endo-1,4-beta-mannosidase